MNPFRQETCLYDNERSDRRIQVFDRGENRELRFGNHITQSARSHSAPERLVLDYTRAMASGMVFRPEAAEILHVGLGAGSIPAFLHRFFPRLRQRVVEVDPEVIQVAYRFFDLPRSGRLRVTIGDGADFLLATQECYDMIWLDAFHAEGAAPQMSSPTVLALARERLRPGGWLLDNVWGSDRAALRRTVQTVGGLFPDLWSLSVRVESNVILIAGDPRQPLDRAVLRERAYVLEQTVPLEFSHWVERLKNGRLPPE
jgi:spermidine synthase